MKTLMKFQPLYVHEMKSLFVKCQEIEEMRMLLVRTALFSVHKALSQIQDDKYDFIVMQLQIYMR